jgi:hypothetical protein
VFYEPRHDEQRDAMPVSERSLPAMLRAMERKLLATLDESRAQFRHAGLRGGDVEASFREFLDLRLPRYLTVGTGEVIDTHDARSGETDVIVANEDQPFRGNRDEPSVFLVEGVSAAAEIKTRLTTDEVDDAIRKGTKFKELRCFHNQGDQIKTERADLDRFYNCPPYFLVGFESVVATSTLISKVTAAPWVTPSGSPKQPPLPPLDAVFILGRGFAINLVEGGSFGYTYTAGPLAGQRATGWMWQDRETVLVDMLLWLNIVMPKVRRFGSISVQYLREHLSDNTG